jgi:hypothetical protein
MTTFYEPTIYHVTMTLAFVAIFCLVHVIFKNIKHICFWSLKAGITVFLWSILWVCTQLHKLPEWKLDLRDSIGKLINMTLNKAEL